MQEFVFLQRSLKTRNKLTLSVLISCTPSSENTMPYRLPLDIVPNRGIHQPRIKFQESVNVLYKNLVFACFWIVLGNVISIFLIYLSDLVPFLHSQPHFIYCPGTYQCPFGDGLTRAFCSRILLCGARPAQAGKQSVTQRNRRTGWDKSFGRENEYFISTFRCSLYALTNRLIVE